MTQQYTLHDLLTLMSNLRHPELGCSWDRKQTMQTLTAYSLEEVYEVIDAVERQDDAQLRDELGDLLFQIVFYAQIATEEDRFGFTDVVHSIADKLLRRHPHIFPDATLSSFGTSANNVITAEQVAANWELLKNAERKGRAVRVESAEAVSLMDDVPMSLPAMDRARKLQKRAASVGFDWQDYHPVLHKLQEEIAELEQEVSAGDQAKIVAELGDVLFTCANLARHLGVDPEMALRASNRKFEERFRRMENRAAAITDSFATLSTEEMNGLWNEIKKAEYVSVNPAESGGR
ncbi:MAG: nucleoside triphosphate pyrophosphohydrolase [Gammaproteobacteria bacterium]|nr:nucleoside triphosphate pyrophosphohydrolase [Gammaproteobacteria bacterium]MDP2140938.1 nucleoside triphosphate pyrophosphohydrolase [Gammaproteobacteria bacterium]MDP2349318.1 nucleoside triphosphate pyrophosphohydrolase [Gammaproteobacteria bacterium]